MLITAASLRELTYKDLAQLAKERGVRGWHAMRKDQLVRALMRKDRHNCAAGNSVKTRKTTSARKTLANGKTSNAPANGKSSDSKSSTKPRSSRVHRQIVADQRLRDLAQPPASVKHGRNRDGARQDRVIVLVRDPYWLHVHWQVTRKSVERAQAALAENWHGATPLLRLLSVDDRAAANMAETVLEEIEIHSGVNHWYIALQDPPGTYRVHIGYLGVDGSFYVLARSNIVTTPPPGSSDAVDHNWNEVAADCEKIYAQSGGCDENGQGLDVQEVLEERLRRPLGSPMVTRYGSGAERYLKQDREFPFDVDCELIVFGASSPDAYVTLRGEPVKLREDGTFTMRLKMPEKRQVIPVVADSSDGLEQRTTVLAVERNTKIMEPITRDPNE